VNDDELERIWQEAVVASFKVISRNSPGETEKKPQKTSIMITGAENRNLDLANAK
jgi:hypothetical protein